MYCLIIWGINYKSNINKLFIQKKNYYINNKTPNLIHNTYKLHNTDLLFKKKLILNIYELINYIFLNFMHVFNKKLPIDITNKFEYKINNYNIRNNAIIEYLNIKKIIKFTQLMYMVLNFGMDK